MVEPTDGVATRTQRVYEALRADVLGGRFMPGHRLKLVALGQRFGVSVSVVREALTRLAEQGIVVASPQRGFRVVELSIDDLRDLTWTRVQVETLLLRESIEHGGVEWEARLVAAHHALHRTPMLDDDGMPHEGWGARHREFHHVLLAGSDRPRLSLLADSLRDSADLYRRWAWALAGDTDRDPVAEHRRLTELAVAREADRAVAALQEHIERASVALQRWVQSS